MRVNPHLSDTVKPIQIFVSYSHQDEEHREYLEKYLAIMKRNGHIDSWHDRRILPGQEWEQKIHKHLNESDIILLLISADFVASDYCWDIEMMRAMERHNEGSAVVIPILIRSTPLWHQAPFARLQVLPSFSRPISEWNDLDQAYTNVVEGIWNVVEERCENISLLAQERVTWQIVLDDDVAHYTPQKKRAFEITLRKLANDLSLTINQIKEVSVRLEIDSVRAGYDEIKSRNLSDVLSNEFGVKLIEVTEAIGALIRIETRKIGIKEETLFVPLPVGRMLQPSERTSPPLLKAMIFPPSNPLQICFSLDQQGVNEQDKIVGRLGRYFRTILVVKGESLNVNLTPFADYCGISAPLRSTELGQDMLAQDLLLKRFTATLLHPATELGAGFWNEWEAGSGVAAENMATCIRVWIMPGRACVEEKMVDDKGCVILESFIPEVMCEIEYLSNIQGMSSRESTLNDKCLRLFNDLILPKVQEEVEYGANFGLLRQMLSAVVMGGWFRKKYQGYFTDFIDSNETARNGLDVVVPDSDAQELYLQIFEEGVWRHVHQQFNVEKGCVEKRLYIVGGMDFS